MSDPLNVRDMLVVITSEIDQAQALIDEARVTFKHDAEFNKVLDRQQVEVNTKRAEVRILSDIEDIINP